MADRTAKVKAKAIKSVSEIDGDELAVRIIEAQAGIVRPMGYTAAQTMAITDTVVAAAARRAALAAVKMMVEAINAGREVQ